MRSERLLALEPTTPAQVLPPKHLLWCLISLQEQEKEEGENSDAEEQVPEAMERKEHASCGQTGLESVQSAQAVELAGAAPEKEQGNEVMSPRGLCQLRLGGPLLPI